MAGRWVRDEYDEFLGHVARDRALEPDSVRALAQGRVWTGRQALARGLIDEIGGLETAVEKAGRMAGLSKQPEVVSLYRPARRSLWHTAGRLLLGGLFADQDPALEESIPWIPPGSGSGAEFQLGIPSAFPREMGRSILPLEITPIGDLSFDD
jgi:ClpP class serine protease